MRRENNAGDGPNECGMGEKYFRFSAISAAGSLRVM